MKNCIFFSIIYFLTSCIDHKEPLDVYVLNLNTKQKKIKEFIAYKNNGTLDTIYKLEYSLSDGLLLFSDSTIKSFKIMANFNIDSVNYTKYVKLRFRVSDKIERTNFTDGEYLLIYEKPGFLFSSDFFNNERINTILKLYKAEFSTKELQYYGWNSLSDSVVVYHSQTSLSL